MAPTNTELKEQTIPGEFSTAEVTHVSKALQMEGLCYLHNHLRMGLTGTQGVLREWHDRVTKPNLHRFTEIGREMGLPPPFLKPLEERENEMKAQLQGLNVAGTLTEGEAVLATIHDAEHVMAFYTQSYNLATIPRAAQAFRDNLDNALENKARLLQAYRETPDFFAPPIALRVAYRGAQASGPAGGARAAGGGQR